MKLAAVALVASLAAVLLTPAAAGPRGSEFTPSVVLTNTAEMGQNCLDMVDRALKFNAKSIKIVPTVHYYGSEERINSFCIRNDWGGCDAPSANTIATFTDRLAKCVARAAAGGANVALLAHLDNMAQYTWRNLLQFNPLQKYGGYSYADVVLKPIATAVNRGIKPSTKVMFMLQGETGKSVSQYSKQWLQLVPLAKQWVAAGGKTVPSNVAIGISLNYNKVYGWLDFTSINPAAISNELGKAWKEQAPRYPMDLKNMKLLYDTIDVMGVSAYPPLAPGFGYNDLEVTLKYHDMELRYAGIDIRALMKKGKQLVISEWGVGGGTQDGQSVAASLEDVAGYPFFGLWYPYATYKDPWRVGRYNDYRKKLYSMTSSWLKNRGGPTYRVDGIYVWTAGSWDALGVHYATYGNGGTWADEGIKNLVKAHNKAVNS